MAAKTPSSVTPINVGGREGFVAVFADIDNADTWASGLTADPLGKYIDNTTDGTVISATVSSGIFTFTVASSGTNKAATILVIK